MAKGGGEQGGGGGGGDRTFDFLWGVVVVIAIGFLSWYYGRVQIAMAIFRLRLIEIYAINFIIIFWLKFIHFFNLPLPSPNLTALNNWIDFIHKNYGGEIDFQILAKLSTETGNYVRYFVVFILLILALILYFGGTIQNFRNTFNMTRLRATEHQNWPQISPIMAADLLNKDLDQAPWAMALSPMKYCKQLDLLNIELKNNKPIATLRRGAAFRTLSLQLGSRWTNPSVLPIHLIALFAIFVARICGDKISADNLVDQIAASAVNINSNLNFAGAENLMQKYVNDKRVQKIINIHAYVVTVFASLLASSREAGVLATSEFIWLKPLDRRMWYMLNSVGRSTSVAEISGAFAHWVAEKKLGLPLIVPTVDEAVKGLEIALLEIIYKPDED